MLITNSIASGAYSTAAASAGARLTGAVSALDTVNGLLDLTTTPRPVASVLGSADSAGAKDSFALLARLLQQGVVGTETYDVNGRPYTRFIETTIGDRRLDGLTQYRDRSVSSTNLNQRA